MSNRQQTRSKRHILADTNTGVDSDAAPKAVEAPKAAENEQITHPCVLVVRVPGEPGNINIQIAPMNDIDPLTIPSLLRAAAKVQERELGIGD